ncbi:uncharacterized protein EV420DRAFT_1479197 [Desarmillaria tabescens]|uniref:BTB domain-containing protein n=1 Tax=Armillaria tabescens TaxID=1929756 RepID=A0AA39KFZ6_ARMTA|nr:uncharacterized protein EV420DRAFT_1479197 [Desarmillaria tabescens]KAK0459176.1 hypothetical protein EV420DRAFT_1479197 [Desarmillaria tabescens]
MRGIDTKEKPASQRLQSASAETERAQWTRNMAFYWETSVFLVEDELFRAPRYQFINHSDTFKAMFTLPQAENTNVEGSSDDNPIRLQGISKLDFERLLQYMYPTYDITDNKSPWSRFSRSSRNIPPVLTRPLEDWISILKLSTIWFMTDIRNQVIPRIIERHLQIDVIERITLGRKYDLPALVTSGVTSLVNQDGGVSEDQAEALGWDTTLRIQWIRDKLLTDRLGRSYAFGESQVRSIAENIFQGEWSFSKLPKRNSISGSSEFTTGRQRAWN